MAERSLYFGGPDLHLGGGGARGRHRNEGCTIKSQMGMGGQWVRAHDVNGGGGDRVASCQ